MKKKHEFPVIDPNWIDGQGFAKMFIKQVAKDLEDIMKDFSNKQLSSIAAVSKKYIPNSTIPVNKFCKNALETWPPTYLQKENSRKRMKKVTTNIY